MSTFTQQDRSDWACRLWCSAGEICVKINLLGWPRDFIDKAERSEASLDALSVFICRFWRFNRDTVEAYELSQDDFHYIHDFAMIAFLSGLDVEAGRSELNEVRADLEISQREITKLHNKKGGAE